MTPRATLIVHLDGGRERALRCLRAIAALEPDPTHEVVIVDDATSGLESLLASLAGDVTILRSDRREGPIAGALRAAPRANADVLVLLRDTPELQPTALAPLLAALADPAAAAAASVPPDDAAAHPVTAHVLALRTRDASLLRPAPDLAAACVELARKGDVKAVPESVAHPPGARALSARSTPGTRAELTVVIPTLDAASERVRACVAAVQSATDAAHQIVVVDNGAPPQGFTAPVNAGLRAVDTPYAVVMNDDVEPLPGWWRPLRAALDDGAAVAFPLTIDGAMREDFAAWCFALTRDAIDEWACAPGEFFDSRLRVWYQDTDLLTRLRQASAPPRLIRESTIRHGLSQTVATEDPQLGAWIRATVQEDRAAFLRKHPDAVLTTA